MAATIAMQHQSPTRKRAKGICSLACALGFDGPSLVWIAARYQKILENARLARFEQVMGTTAGRCLRVLADRENWYLQSGPDVLITLRRDEAHCAGTDAQRWPARRVRACF